MLGDEAGFSILPRFFLVLNYRVVKRSLEMVKVRLNGQIWAACVKTLNFCVFF